MNVDIEHKLLFFAPFTPAVCFHPPHELTCDVNADDKTRRKWESDSKENCFASRSNHNLKTVDMWIWKVRNLQWTQFSFFSLPIVTPPPKHSKRGKKLRFLFRLSSVFIHFRWKSASCNLLNKSFCFRFRLSFSLYTSRSNPCSVWSDVQIKSRPETKKYIQNRSNARRSMLPFELWTCAWKAPNHGAQLTRKGKPTIGLLRFVVFLPLVIIVSFIANGIILDKFYMLSRTLERKKEWWEVEAMGHPNYYLFTIPSHRIASRLIGMLWNYSLSFSRCLERRISAQH